MKNVVEKKSSNDMTVAIVKNGNQFQTVYLHKLQSGKWQSTVCNNFVKVSDDSDENIIKALSAVGTPASFNTLEAAHNFIHLND